LTLVLLKRWFIPHNYLQVGLHVLISFVPYGGGILWAVWSKRVWQVRIERTPKEIDEVADALMETYQEEP
jgi:hypothetical protein